jgi:hypothetical protein
MPMSREQIFRVPGLVHGSCPCEAMRSWCSLMKFVYSMNYDYVLLCVRNLVEEKYCPLITEFPIGF